MSNDDSYLDEESAAAIRADADRILKALPEWFGIPEARDAYVEGVGRYPFFTAEGEDGEVIGFISIRPTFETAAEIYVIAVDPEFHRLGIGGALVETAETWLAAEGVKLLYVKTLAPSNPSPAYAATRDFYTSCGFLPLDVVEGVWNAANPCLFMVKPLESGEE